MNFQAASELASIVNEAQLAEPIHEEADSRAGSADDLCQCLLADLRNHWLRFALFPEVGQQKQHPRQSLFAGIEELVDQIFLDPNVARQQMVEEHFGKGW